MKSPFASRKFIMAIAGGIVVLINAVLDAKGLPSVSADTVLAFVGLVVSYIFTQGAVDFAAHKNPSNLLSQVALVEPLNYQAAAQPLTTDQLHQVETHMARVQRIRTPITPMAAQTAPSPDHGCQTGATPSEK